VVCYNIIVPREQKEETKMKVKDLIKQLLECPLNADVVIAKELNYNAWIGGTPFIESADREAVVLNFDCDLSKLEIKRKD
jgi:hypothetical protein